MSIFLNLSTLAVQQLVQSAANTVGLNVAGDALVASLRSRFTDHSQKLTQALQNANDRAWKAIELSLAGETFWDRCKVALAKAEDQAFRQQVRTFLDGSPLTKVSSDHPKLCQQCLSELRRARKHGLLTSGAVAPGRVGQEGRGLCPLRRPAEPPRRGVEGSGADGRRLATAGLPRPCPHTQGAASEIVFDAGGRGTLLLPPRNRNRRPTVPRSGLRQVGGHQRAPGKGVRRAQQSPDGTGPEA